MKVLATSITGYGVVRLETRWLGYAVVWVTTKGQRIVWRYLFRSDATEDMGRVLRHICL